MTAFPEPEGYPLVAADLLLGNAFFAQTPWRRMRRTSAARPRDSTSMSRRYSLRKNPGAIRLDRTAVQKGWMGCSCVAVFWTPTGTLECSVRALSGFTVTEASCSR